MNKPKEIILHCSATAENKPFTAADIEKWHKKRGFKKIGYHYVIKLDGTVEKGRDEKESGAHTVNHNSKSIGICYVGGLTKDGKTPKDTRTDKQKEAMYRLVKDIMNRYNIPLNEVHGHYEFAAKACPSFRIDDFRQEFEQWEKSNKNHKNSNVLITTTSDNSFKRKFISFIYKLIKFFLKLKK